MDYEVNILYYINIYKKWWKRIVLVVVISMSLTIYLSSLTPVTYVSTVILLSSGGGETSIGPLGRILGISGLSGGSSTDAIIPLLNSRRMADDIRARFNLDKRPKFRYRINTRDITGGMAIDVKGSDPILTQKIANFAVGNLDKINQELDITPQKPMVKVLDPAIRGVQVSRQILRKMLISGILAFLFMSLYAFFSDYLKKLSLKLLSKS